MVTATDRIRGQYEYVENEIQNAQAQRERITPSLSDKVQTKARKKAGKDRVRASAKQYQDTIEKYQVTYVGKSPPKTGKAQTQARAKSAKQGVGGSWVFEGTYGTKAEADVVRKGYKRRGYFVRVIRLKQGGYSLWIKEGVGAEGEKSPKFKERMRKFASKDRTIAPPTEARWVDFGTLPEYKPPNFQLDKSGYKPLDYHPIDNKPMFQHTGFKTMEYKPISSEPYYKASGVGTQPYYKKFEYKPIGQFGGNHPTIMSSEPTKRKRGRKAKVVRMVGE